MPKTPNHDYNIPPEGTENWHVPLNENFENLDVDIEIRDSDENKSEYKPKEGSKYEATDSGAIYYGNGEAWIEANRKVGHIETNSSVTGEHLKAGDSSTAIVAPSVDSAFDGIQEAIDEGYRDVILAEEITEAGIIIPKVDREGSETDRFRLSGVGQGQYQTINDPGTEEFVIRAEPGETRDVNSRVLIENIFFNRETSNSGFAILGAKNIHDPDGPWNAAGNWILRDIVSRAGPIATVGPRNILINVDVANWSQRMFPIIGKTNNDTGEVIYDRYAGLFRGATFGMYGGALMSKTAARSAAYIGAGGWSMTGGITFTNAREHRDNEFYSSNLCFIGASRGFLAGMSTEGSTDYDVQFGLEDSGDGPGDSLSDTTIYGSSAFDSINIQTSVNNVRIQSFTNTKIRKEKPATIEIISNYDVEYENGHNPWLPHEITHLNPYDGGVYRIGGNRSSPSTTIGLQIQESEPNFPKEATIAVADGTGWDPVGSGNAAIVAYDTDGEWKTIFEYSSGM